MDEKFTGRLGVVEFFEGLKNQIGKYLLESTTTDDEKGAALEELRDHLNYLLDDESDDLVGSSLEDGKRSWKLKVS